MFCGKSKIVVTGLFGRVKPKTFFFHVTDRKNYILQNAGIDKEMNYRTCTTQHPRKFSLIPHPRRFIYNAVQGSHEEISKQSFKTHATWPHGVFLFYTT